MKEVWRRCTGSDSDEAWYEVSSEGRCRKIRMLKPREVKGGHRLVASEDGKRTCLLVNREVWWAFVGMPQGYVRMIDKTKGPELSNLFIKHSLGRIEYGRDHMPAEAFDDDDEAHTVRNLLDGVDRCIRAAAFHAEHRGDELDAHEDLARAKDAINALQLELLRRKDELETQAKKPIVRRRKKAAEEDED